MRPGKRQQEDEDADPPDAGQRQRRHVARDIAREHDIAGPEQRGQAEQQIGLVEEPAERRVMLWCSRQEKDICAGKASRGKASKGIGAMREGAYIYTCELLAMTRRAV